VQRRKPRGSGRKGYKRGSRECRESSGFLALPMPSETSCSLQAMDHAAHKFVTLSCSSAARLDVTGTVVRLQSETAIRPSDVALGCPDGDEERVQVGQTDAQVILRNALHSFEWGSRGARGEFPGAVHTYTADPAPLLHLSPRFSQRVPQIVTPDTTCSRVTGCARLCPGARGNPKI
jgi:hypothetical protein